MSLYKALSTKARFPVCQPRQVLSRRVPSRLGICPNIRSLSTQPCPDTYLFTAPAFQVSPSLLPFHRSKSSSPRSARSYLTMTTPAARSALIRGTSTDVRFSRVVDGDTIRIYAPGASKDESVRILALDTEESYSGSSKPVTPWGKAAKKFATEFFADADTVTIEFSGNDPLDLSFSRYRGNYGRLLVYVYLNGVDYQETMIRLGYSPYYTKYGNAEFISHHLRYTKAEREAQMATRGVWDQLTVNGSIVRDYPTLQTWWHLRASIVDQYRALRAIDPTVYNTRLDYAKLVELANEGAVATIFTEVRTVKRVASAIGLIGIGAEDRPFNLMIPDLDSEQGRDILSLLNMRYITVSDASPKRGYCYVTGRLEMYRNNPQMVVTSPHAITDSLASRAEVAGLVPMPTSSEGAAGDTVMTPVPDGEEVVEENGSFGGKGGKDLVIAALLPDPGGSDRGKETVTVRNRGKNEVELKGWLLLDKVGKTEKLSGSVKGGKSLVISLSGRGVRLNNNGDEVLLKDPTGIVVNKVAYTKRDVAPGRAIDFS